MESERRSERYPSDRPLAIRCETWSEFVEAYASDICRGGMFIRSEQVPEVLSQVELRLHLPEGVEVAIHARVVHVVPAEQAARHNGVAGMGVEFVHVDAEQKRQVLQLVEFARAQHEGNADPNASFTRTLLETSSSMPARDVAARLSMLPAGAGEPPRARRASQVAMQAVQSHEAEPAQRPDPSEVAVKAHTSPADRQRITRTATQPLNDPSGASDARLPIARPQTQPVARPQVQAASPTSRSSATNPIVRTATQPIDRPPTGPVQAASPTSRSSATKPIVRTATQPIARPPTGPVQAASPSSRSSATNPIVRTATQPIARPPTGPVQAASPTSRSSATNPIVRTATQPIARPPTGPLTAAGARPNTGPIARTPTGPLDPHVANANASPSQPADPSPSGSPAPDETEVLTTPSGQPLPPPKPTDLSRLKLVLNSLAHKHFEDAARQARDMLLDNPGDPQVLKWQAICFARMAIGRNEPDAALPYYAKVLRYEENNREAREFVKTHQRDKKLNSLPFGRYFTTKKK